MKNGHVRPALMLAARLARIGFVLVAPAETARVFARHGLAVEVGDADGATLVIDTCDGPAVPCAVTRCTSLDGAHAAVAAIEALGC